ncbi:MULTISPECIES: acyl carrier protein [Streptomyces]|uniref:Acyl carrier protein n=1 Tax=Streptomyces ardesiacus TaxID=285564 RepID=A0ABW8HIK2_9ACTN|nr:MULTISPECIES: acyl carrier protein [Streptomyces]MCL7370306.1 acyl carrier protein [Streptomyces ardesiacus]NEB62592.1 acyl carrier protein [Streptomyces diastaticus]
MDRTAPGYRALAALPLSERRTALRESVVAEFRTALLLGDGEELALDANYFDLGLTSLRATELKQRLEQRFGAGINEALLFESPTVARLLEHLAADVLAELFGTERRRRTEQRPEKALVGKLLDDLYKK